MKKELSSLQVQEMKKVISCKGFLSKEEVVFYRQKFGFSYELFKSELINKQIPFICGNLFITLRACGLELVDKKIKIEDFNKISWGVEVFKNSKIKVLFTCKECGCNTESRLAKTINRVFFPLEPICAKCINKLVSNTEEQRRKNSEAQLKSQGTPEARSRMADIVRERYKNIEYCKKISEASKKVWKREGYREKMVELLAKRWDEPGYAKRFLESKNKKYIFGVYKNLFYNSSYELAFLLKEEHERGSIEHISRVYFYIDYINKDGKKSKYFGDFIKDDEFFIEVKGYGPWVDLKNLELKNKAAREWCDKNNKKFRLVEYKDFENFWYTRAIKMHKKLKNGENNKSENS